MKVSKVLVNVNVVRLLFVHILLNAVSLREFIKDSISSDAIKIPISEYLSAVFRDLDKLRSIILPTDSDLGSIDLETDEKED